jgi:hypothetical protein
LLYKGYAPLFQERGWGEVEYNGDYALTSFGHDPRGEAGKGNTNLKPDLVKELVELIVI